MSGKSEIAKKILEKLLPKTENVLADDAARAALRQNPEKYAEYLKTLDTAYGTASERAKQMGFGADTLYHGSPNKDINKFIPSQGGTSGPGVYTTPIKHEAKWYGPEVYPLKTNAKIVDLSNFENTKKIASELGVDKNLTNPSQQFYSNEYNELKNSIMKDLKDKDVKKFESLVGHDRDKYVYDKLKEKGYDATKITQNGGEQVVNIPDPSKIRHTNAAFDPRFKESSDILAGGAVIPMGLGGSKKPATEQMVQDDKTETRKKGILGKLKDAFMGNTDSPILQDFKAAQSGYLKPGDENVPANNIRNLLVDKLGLPKDWAMSKADEKQWLAGLPEQIGTSAGTVGKVKKLTAAEQIMAQRAAGKTGPLVLKTAQELAEDANKLKFAQRQAPVNLAEQVRNPSTPNPKAARANQLKLDIAQAKTPVEKQGAMDAYNSFMQEMIDTVRKK